MQAIEKLDDLGYIYSDVCRSTTKSVIWLGAGYTCCLTKGALPVTANFFDSRVQDRFPALAHFLTSQLGGIVGADLEAAIDRLDDLRSAPWSPVSSAARATVVDQRRVRDELTDYIYLRLCTEVPGRALNRWAADLLCVANTGCTVITMNYDTFAERLLSGQRGRVHGYANTDCHHCRTKQLLLQNCRCDDGAADAPNWRGAILKLHGSVAWAICRNPACRQHGCLVPDERCKPKLRSPCGCCGSVTEPAIVTPTRHKDFGAVHQISRMWDAAEKALSDAEILVVFGYSFPTNDYHARQLAKIAIGQNANLRRVVTFDVAAMERLNAFSALVGLRPSVEQWAFSVPRDHSEPRAWKAMFPGSFPPEEPVGAVA